MSPTHFLTFLAACSMFFHASSKNVASAPFFALASAASLRVRNWQEGDRFRQAHSAGEKKVKDLLQELKVPRELRRRWPVVSSGDRILWVKGARPLPLLFADRKGLHRLVIEDRVMENRDAT